MTQSGRTYISLFHRSASIHVYMCLHLCVTDIFSRISRVKNGEQIWVNYATNMKLLHIFLSVQFA